MAEISADDYDNEIPQPRKPLTRVPIPPPEHVTKQRMQEQEQQQQIPEEEGVPTKAYYTDEYDEERELRAKTMPTIYSFLNEKEQFEQLYGKDADPEEIERQYGPIKYREFLKPLMDTPNFNISDIHIRDSKGSEVIGTFSVIFIKPHMQVLPLFMKSDNKDPETQKRCIYEVMFGQGLLCIANLTRHVMKSDIFWVEPNVEHNFFNTSNQPLVMRLWYDGHVDLRDRYFPKQRIQEVARESRREIFNVQEQKDVPVGQQQPNKYNKSESRFA
jgi:mannose-6-phosphate isomerase-like protein (cupin superfamily)